MANNIINTNTLFTETRIDVDPEDAHERAVHQRVEREIDEESSNITKIETGFETRKIIREGYKDPEAAKLCSQLYSEGSKYADYTHDDRNIKGSAEISKWSCCDNEIYLSKIRPLFEKPAKARDEILPHHIFDNRVKSTTTETKTVRKGKPGAGGRSSKKKDSILLNEKIQTALVGAKNIIADYRSYVDDSAANPVFALKSRGTKMIELYVLRYILNAQQMIDNYLSALKNFKTVKSDRRPRKEEVEEVTDMLNKAEKEMYEMIIGAEKLYQKMMSCPEIFEGHQIVKDFRGFIKNQRELCSFDLQTVAIKYCELIFKTRYDYLIQTGKKYSLNSMQSEVMRYIQEKSGPTDYYLGFLRSGLGTGKTALALPIAGYLSAKRVASNSSTYAEKVLFVYPTSPVLIDAASMLNRVGNNYSIVTVDPRNPNRYVAWDRKKSKDGNALYCSTYITDFHTAHMILRQQNMNKLGIRSESDGEELDITMMVIDEPTMGADKVNGPYTRLFVQLMKLAPGKIILMSGTMPEYNRLERLYESCFRRFPGMSIIDFTPAHPKIGCMMTGQNGGVYMPHQISDNIETLGRIVESVRANPMVGRCYTFECLNHIIKTSNQEDKISTTTMMNDPSQATQEYIQKRVLDILSTITDINWKPMNASVLDPTKIFRSDYPFISKGTLVFCSSPVDVAISWYRNNYNSDKIDNAPSMGRILEKYTERMKRWQQECKSKSKAAATQSGMTISKSIRENATPQSLASLGVVSDLPKWEFETKYCLGFIEHCRANGYSSSACGGIPVAPEDFASSFNSMDNRLLYLLACGIGVYSSTSKLLPKSYLEFVIQAMSAGKIKIIFCDGSLAYGLNLPVSTIILVDQPIESVTNPGTVHPSIVDIHSIKTIFQMFGRAGRGGNLSYRADAYLVGSDRLFGMIDSYLANTLDEGTRDEAVNILSHLD
jgi:hypothetical protein